MACFVFGGIDYSDVLDVESIDMPALPATSPELRTASGRDGALLAGNRLEPLEIKIKARLATDGIDPRDIQRRWAQEAARMRSEEPQALYLTQGVYRMAVLADASPLEFRSYSATAELTFLGTLFPGT